MAATHPLVRDLLPTFATELETGLAGFGRSALAQQVAELIVWGRCTCGDDFCSSFYTGPKPEGAWRDEGEYQNVVADVLMGMVILDVVNGRIRYVEVLDRPDVKQLLMGLGPPGEQHHNR